MSHPILQLVSAADSKFYPGLLVALGSALACASGDFDYSITVLDGGIPDDDWAAMDSHLQRIGRKKHTKVRLFRIDANRALVAGMPSRRGSVLTFARLAIPSIMDVPKAIYIDSDVVCLRGVEEFWTGLDTGAAIVAVRDPLGTLGRDPLTRQLPKSKHKQPYFNAGIIGMNLERWRDPEVEAQINNLLSGAKSFRYVDQSLLNLVFHDQWHDVPGACNRLLTLAACSELGHAVDPANYHYIGSRKPWLTTISNFYRHAPNLLFDRMHQWICDGGSNPPRTICPKSLATARRKSRLYRLFLPARSRYYSGALAVTRNANTIVDQLFGIRKSTTDPADTRGPQQP